MNFLLFFLALVVVKKGVAPSRNYLFHHRGRGKQDCGRKLLKRLRMQSEPRMKTGGSLVAAGGGHDFDRDDSFS